MLWAAPHPSCCVSRPRPLQQTLHVLFLNSLIYSLESKPQVSRLNCMFCVILTVTVTVFPFVKVLISGWIVIELNRFQPLTLLHSNSIGIDTWGLRLMLRPRFPITSWCATRLLRLDLSKLFTYRHGSRTASCSLLRKHSLRHSYTALSRKNVLKSTAQRSIFH